MEHAFWLERWDEGQIGFHRQTVNPTLARFHGQVLADCKRILVPLCGKSIDLWWLRDQGHEVVGVELAEKAVRAFFQEEGVAPDLREEDGFTVWSTAGLQVYQGDFFSLTGTFDGVWDRAALVALPPQMRLRYAKRINALVTGKGLLSSFDYPQDERKGPPHAVTDDEVRRLYANVELLDENDLTEVMQQRGWNLSRIEERAYALDLR